MRVFPGQSCTSHHLCLCPRPTIVPRHGRRPGPSLSKPQAQEAVIVKHYPNSFRETGLQALLEEQGIEEVVVVGAMSHMCIDATARAAADLGYGVTVVADACATRDLEFAGKTVAAADVHAAFMSALAFGYANVVAADDLPVK